MKQELAQVKHFKVSNLLNLPQNISLVRKKLTGKKLLGVGENASVFAIHFKSRSEPLLGIDSRVNSGLTDKSCTN
jgi:hypothetical protein